jgi:hypothetical protein
MAPPTGFLARGLRALRRGASALLIVGLAASCQDEEALPTPTPGTPQTCGGSIRSAVVTTLSFTREAPKGTAPGFDLDKLTSDGNDDTSCRKRDFVDAEGRVGIDNQLAALIPDIEALVGDAVDGLVQGAINDGLLLIALDFDGIDDLQNDACFGLSVGLAKGTPTLGTDGVIEGFQTFVARTDVTPSLGQQGRIENGLLTIGPMDVDIPLKLFDVSFTLRVYDAYFRFRIDEDGFMDGHLGGGIVPEELIDGIKDGAGLDDIIPLVRTVLKTSADLKPDAEGACQQVSVAVAIKAAPRLPRPLTARTPSQRHRGAALACALQNGSPWPRSARGPPPGSSPLTAPGLPSLPGLLPRPPPTLPPPCSRWTRRRPRTPPRSWPRRRPRTPP